MQLGPDQPAPRLISLTPLIDVVFILLVFFMLASSFLDWHAVDLKLAGGADTGESTGESVLVRVEANGAFSLDGRDLDAAGLEAALSSRLSDRPDLPVVLRPGTGVSLQRAISTLDLLKRAGVNDVSLARDR